jgi:hypothetical protein
VHIPILAELQQVKSTSNNQQTANGMGLLIFGRISSGPFFAGLSGVHLDKPKVKKNIRHQYLRKQMAATGVVYIHC